MQGAVDKIVDRDLQVKVSYDNEDADDQSCTRYVEILGFTKTPCGGTHVKTTKEIG